MNRAKYFITVFIGTLVYVSLSMMIGQNSIKCFNQLEEQKRIISKQTTDIQNINSELQLELTALENDKAVIAAYARKLDYVCDNEKLIKISGLKPVETTLYDTGTVIRHEEPKYLSEKWCKVISFIVFAGLFVIFLLLDISKGNISFSKDKKAFVAGIPVYDVQQI